MKLFFQDYQLSFQDGGLEVMQSEKLLYFCRHPLFVTIKTHSAVSAFYDGPYTEVSPDKDGVTASGILSVPSGASFAFTDHYRPSDTGFTMSRQVRVLTAGDELGFSTKFSLTMAESDSPRDYQCFAPGAWYKQNEFGPDSLIGKDLDCEYFWQLETRFALPLFAMYRPESGQTAALSRLAADITLRNLDIARSENNVDPDFTIGSIGMSKPSRRTLNYMYLVIV